MPQLISSCIYFSASSLEVSSIKIRTQALLLNFSRLSEYIAHGRLSKAFAERMDVNGEDGAVCLVTHCEQMCCLRGVGDTLSEKIGLQLRPERQAF